MLTQQYAVMKGRLGCTLAKRVKGTDERVEKARAERVAFARELGEAWEVKVQDMRQRVLERPLLIEEEAGIKPASGGKAPRAPQDKQEQSWANNGSGASAGKPPFEFRTPRIPERPLGVQESRVSKSRRPVGGQSGARLGAGPRGKASPAQVCQEHSECEKMLEVIHRQRMNREHALWESFADRVAKDVSASFARWRRWADGGAQDDEALATLVSRFLDLAQRKMRRGRGGDSPVGQEVGSVAADAALCRNLIAQNIQLSGKLEEVEWRLSQLTENYCAAADQFEFELSNSESAKGEAQRAEEGFWQQAKQMADMGWRKDTEAAELRGKIKTAERMVLTQQQYIDALKRRLETGMWATTVGSSPPSSSQPVLQAGLGDHLMCPGGIGLASERAEATENQVGAPSLPSPPAAEEYDETADSGGILQEQARESPRYQLAVSDDVGVERISSVPFELEAAPWDPSSPEGLGQIFELPPGYQWVSLNVGEDLLTGSADDDPPAADLLAAGEGCGAAQVASGCYLEAVLFESQERQSSEPATTSPGTKTQSPMCDDFEQDSAMIGAKPGAMDVGSSSFSVNGSPSILPGEEYAAPNEEAQGNTKPYGLTEEEYDDVFEEDDAEVSPLDDW